MSRLDRLFSGFMHWSGISHQCNWGYTLFDPTEAKDGHAYANDKFPYKDFVIEVNRVWFDKARDEDVLDVLLHEVGHIHLFAPLRHVAGMAQSSQTGQSKEYEHWEEQGCDLFARWMLRLWPKGGFDRKTGEPIYSAPKRGR